MSVPDLSWRLLALLALGGALGTIARHLVSALAPQTGFPWGTLVVNVTGSVLLAFLMFGGVAKGWVSPHMRVTLGVAFFGAYTTMSTFAYESMVLLERGGFGPLAANLALNPGLCLVGVWIGRGLAQAVPVAG